ncbi:MAG TPA: redoxin domain-containing protein [Planctomycetaceae bacterium]
MSIAKKPADQSETSYPNPKRERGSDVIRSLALRVGVTIAMLALASQAAIPSAQAADAPSVKTALGLKPLQADVDYDIPDAKSIEQCKVSLAKDPNNSKASGWLVSGPAGQPLRRFMDSDGDGEVDQYSYFKNGLEVYREFDSGKNHRKDQFRWMNFGGTRWGVDTNKDGKIDVWKQISVEEVSRIAVKALVSQDASLLTPLLVTKEDLKRLGIQGNLETKLLAAVADPAARLKKAVASSKIINPRTNWLRFDASPPAVVPGESIKAAGDLTVYENVMAIIDYGNQANPGLVHVGELIRMGDVWKMTSLPIPMEGTSFQLEPGLVMNEPLLGSGKDAAVAEAPATTEEQELVEQLQKLQASPPAANATRPVWEKYQKSVEALLVKLVNKAKTDEARNLWTRQLLDTIAVAVQSGAEPSGLARLKKLESEIDKADPKSSLAATARYRVMSAEYTVAMQEAGKDDEVKQKIHDRWLTSLEDFLDAFPKSDDAPEVGLQLAMELEFAGKVEKATKRYQRLVDDFGETPAAIRAAGALKRLDLVDKPLLLAGPSLSGGTLDVKQFRGKLLCVIFWDTVNEVCKEDLAPLKALYTTYHADGFEILGVNLDSAKTAVGPYLTQNGVKWPQIHDGGGPEKGLGVEFGIMVVPTMFIVDRDGKVLNRSATIAELKAILAEKLAKK